MSIYPDLSLDQLLKLAQALTSDLDGTDLRETWSVRELHPDLYDELHLRALALVRVESEIAAAPIKGMIRAELLQQATDDLR